ncbi:BZ3500_MvSof-1268-A1-R1_Chr9g10499 [Microbotryum saponariae]|uniref:BZ3500_MvSof-1268-A1-R1_Chr9g10499 protein n=1 Tax=Microbotryum saponariae TaxID=289078 RepID=A0A2X0KBD1_9BASI|nr:BZ3501_MvSof-1269-A2-R1_Chr9g10248 [Microbotryum saponariae]SDA00197.1 BZ3500_MvSof-1268-A1-R1_Chr9g10499 [Microbotryum saponariae]
MAQHTPVPFGPIQFAHPSAMPSLIPSTGSLGNVLRKRAGSFIGFIKTNAHSPKNVAKGRPISNPTLVQSSHDLLLAMPSRSPPAAGAPSELPPSYRQSWLSFSRDESTSSGASQHTHLPQETDADDDILYITRVEIGEQLIAERKIVDLLEKDRVMDQEFRRLGL